GLSTGLSTLIIRPPRSRALEDQERREALEAKARALAASPREGKPDFGVHARSGGQGGRNKVGGNGARRKLMKRAPATSEKRGMYHGIQVPLDAFEKPFAGGSDVDALPGRLESVIFPHRYINWPKEDAAFSTLAKDMETNPIRHAVAFRSGQPRIMCHDPQRETRGWAGPGAYEWDDRPDANKDDGKHTNDNGTGNSRGDSNDDNFNGASEAGNPGEISDPAGRGGGGGSSSRNDAASTKH
ncbi:unnamed protein product, partial [Scytosiphon promiscuus]